MATKLKNEKQNTHFDTLFSDKVPFSLFLLDNKLRTFTRATP